MVSHLSLDFFGKRSQFIQIKYFYCLDTLESGESLTNSVAPNSRRSSKITATIGLVVHSAGLLGFDYNNRQLFNVNA